MVAAAAVAEVTAKTGESGGSDGDQDGDEEGEEASDEVNVLIEVTKALQEIHGRVPTIDEVKDALRKITEAQKGESSAMEKGLVPPPAPEARQVIEIPPSP